MTHDILTVASRKPSAAEQESRLGSSGIAFARSNKEWRLSLNHHRVLLVDDDDDVRETSADMLAELGYCVMQAANGFEALEKLETHPNLEVMVTDVRMPGMSGLELTAIAGERYSGLRIIVMSGYFTPQPIKCRFLQKPIRTTELDAAIRAELECRPGT